jgi:hypothetical protein
MSYSFPTIAYSEFWGDQWLYFFYWLMGDALLPGANTPSKFVYKPRLTPVFVAIAFFTDLRPRQFNAWLAYSGLVFLAALLVATFWPW